MASDMEAGPLARLEQAALGIEWEAVTGPVPLWAEGLCDAASELAEASEGERLAGLLATARREERERIAALLEAKKAEFSTPAHSGLVHPAALGALTNAILWIQEEPPADA